MGALRTLFAISVVFAHSGLPSPYVFVGGRNAVQLFYMISGFLISYILNNTPAYRNPITFYKSRALRIYPIYYVVAFFALIGSCFGVVPALATLSQVPWDAKALLIGSNALIFGQDWVMFTAVHHHQMHFSANFALSDIPVWKGLLVPQAWTLGVELTFYLVAPYILRSRYRVIVLLSASLLLRMTAFIFARHIAGSDPWTYRFFPFELSLFLLGALSQQVVLPLWKKYDNVALAVQYGTWFFIALSICCFMIPIREGFKSVFLIATFFVCLPLTFEFQNKHKSDGRLGELSYPIYIGHLLIIDVMAHISGKFGIDHPVFIAMLDVAAAIGFAIALNTFIAQPIELFRKNLKVKKTPNMSGDTAPSVYVVR